jgi:hypothetical protein
MADHIGDDISTDGTPIPDVPQTALAFRTWRLSESNRLLSINAPNLTGKAGGSPQQGTRKIGWIHRHLADDEGQHGWPIGDPLMAHCGVRGEGAEAIPEHGKIPSKECSCGIYATTEIKVINSYLGVEQYMGVAIRGPVLGIVEMGGRVIPATQGYRARFARVAAILAIPSEFSLARAHLAQIAELYQVPLLEDISKDPEDYREAIGQMPAVTDPSSVGDDLEQWLKDLTDGEDKKEDDEEGGE